MPRTASVGEDFHRAACGHCRGRLVVHDYQIVAAAFLEAPLSADQRRLCHIACGKGGQPGTVPGQRANDRVQPGPGYRLGNSICVPGVAHTAHGIGGNLKQRVYEADRLCPLTPGGCCVPFGQAAC